MSFLSKIFPCLRKRRREPNSEFSTLRTNYGITIKLSPLSEKLTTAEVDEWSNWLIHFWNQAGMGWNRTSLASSLNGVVIEIKDIENMDIQIGDVMVKVNAYTLPISKKTVICCKPGKRNTTVMHLIENLFKHEVSHSIVGTIDSQYWDGEKSHNLFKDKGLGA